MVFLFAQVFHGFGFGCTNWTFILDCELTGAGSSSTRFSQSASASSTPSGPNTNRAHKTDYIDERSPTNPNSFAQGSQNYQQDTSGYNPHSQG